MQIFDSNTSIYQGDCNARFGVGQALPTMPPAMRAVLLAVLLAMGLTTLRRRWSAS